MLIVLVFMLIDFSNDFSNKNQLKAQPPTPPPNTHTETGVVCDTLVQCNDEANIVPNPIPPIMPDYATKLRASIVQYDDYRHSKAGFLPSEKKQKNIKQKIDDFIDGLLDVPPRFIKKEPQ